MELLPSHVMEQVTRILAGQEGMHRLNDKIVDCLHHLSIIGDSNLAWNHHDDDDSDRHNYCYVHPNGELHKRYQGEPVDATIFYCRAGGHRKAYPHVKHTRLLNHRKCIAKMHHYIAQHASPVASEHCCVHQGESTCTHIPIATSRLEQQRRHMNALIDTHLICQQELNKLRHHLQLYRSRQSMQHH